MFESNFKGMCNKWSDCTMYIVLLMLLIFLLLPSKSNVSKKTEYMHVKPQSKQPIQTSKKASACPTNKQVNGNFISSNLIPKHNTVLTDKAFEFAPKDLKNINFLETEQLIGVDTVSNSLRNASYDIRTTIPNPKNVVSPWLNSDIQPDLTRKSLE